VYQDTRKLKLKAKDAKWRYMNDKKENVHFYKDLQYKGGLTAHAETPLESYLT